MADKEPIVVCKKTGLGLGIAVIGLIQILLPSMSQQIADLDFIETEPFGILTGAVLVIAVILMIAGGVLVGTKFDDRAPK